jgi:hypothetical protein
MSSFVNAGRLVVEFVGGERKEFHLGPREDKVRIRQTRDAAVGFARENGASLGQENAVKKALTDAGYHLTK